MYWTGTGDGVVPQKVEHKYESGDGVDPQTISSGWTEVELEMDLEMKLTPQSTQVGQRQSQTCS